MTENSLVLSHDYVSRAIQNSDLADSTKAQYLKAIRLYLEAGHSLTDAESLAQYAQGLKKSSRAFLKAAVRLVTADLAIKAKGQATPENLATVQAGLYRIEALQEAIKVKQTQGEKAHIWLSQKQVKKLMETCGPDIVDRRDWIVLALLVGAGLRRSEVVTLQFEDIKEQPGKNGNMRTVLDVKGKGTKNRVVPISDKLAARLEEWKWFVGGGNVARSLGMKKELGQSISTIGVFEIVRKRGGMISKPDLAPHDLRRTYAQIGYEQGVSITQISRLLGHSSVATTQRYLNLDLDLEITVSDFIPL